MLDSFYYVNNKGERLSFGEDGVFANYNDLRDYEWEFDDDSGSPGIFERGLKNRTLPTIFCSSTGEGCRSKRNEAYEIFETDVLMHKKGRIYVGDYYMECWIVGADNSQYLRSERFLRTDFKVYTDKPVWKKEQLIECVPNVVDNSKGVKFNIGFNFGLKSSPIALNTINNDARFDSEFKITFYGRTINPQIQIAGHTYRVNCSLQDGERVVVDSSSKTITKYGNDDSVQNFFRYRYKPESVFNKIPAGLSKLTWNGEFGVDIVIIDGRSEPKWTWTEVPTSEIADVVEIDDRYYLLDSDGDYILDSDGDYISTSVGRDES